jgi:hypothetical protein
MDTAVIQSACMTQFTREHLAGEKNPSRNMSNRKPYRTAAQRKQARATAKVIDGRHVSTAPRSYHKPTKS